MAKMRDYFWLWGQDAGTHHYVGAKKENVWKLPGENRMGPVEGANYMGIRNICRVVMGGKPEIPFDAESEKLKNMNEVVWSAIGDSSSTSNALDKSTVDEVIRQAEKYPNITGAILDDFFTNPDNNAVYVPRISFNDMKIMRDKLHNFSKRKLDLWVVWYEYELDYDIQDYLELCDVVTFWTWKGSNLAFLDKNIQKVVTRTPGKRRLAGCYMWNYGECKPLTIEEMKFQCERYYDWIKKGWIEGIIFCSNCICDIGLESVEWTKKWIAEVRKRDI